MSLFKRYVILFFALTIQAVGIVFVVNAGLGTPPVSSLQYVLSIILGITFGQMTFLWNVILVGAQIAILRKDFRKFQLLQIIVAFVFSAWIDVFMALLANMKPELYALKIVSVLIGAALIAFSVAVQKIIDVLKIPGEGFVFTVSQHFGIEVGHTKTAFDCSCVGIAIIFALTCLHKVVGFREGTILAALVTGSMVRFFMKTILKPFREKAERDWLAPKNK